MTPELGPIDRSLRDRATRVVPGGMYGHMRASVAGRLSAVLRPRRGRHLWDVDGNASMSTSCAPTGRSCWATATRGRGRGRGSSARWATCSPARRERMVELAEKLVGMVAHADWALFQKNGTDATTLCVIIARAATEKRKILVAQRRLSRRGAVVHAASRPA